MAFNAYSRLTYGIATGGPIYPELIELAERPYNNVLESVFREEFGALLLEVRITGFRKGSVVVDYEVLLADTATEVTSEEVRETFLVALNETSGEFLPGLVVDQESVQVTEYQAGVPPGDTFPEWGIALICIGVILTIGTAGAVFLIRRWRHNHGKLDISKYRARSAKYHIPRAKVVLPMAYNDVSIEMETVGKSPDENVITNEMPSLDELDKDKSQVDSHSVKDTSITIEE
ncbi:mucin-1-like [Branchiostoma floridae]|uniref:Mucin-1-like n=1 Tax=Branchiostoma floridae TaxID=7739 RepID=A0A9J7KU76_BRAFL|nr:mucin-1-like [Branchiostoma floridae]